MGKYSRVVAEKSDAELEEIMTSILNYQAMFMEDYFLELDKRGLLNEYKKSISDTKLLQISIKLNDFSESKYLAVLFTEIELRKLDVEYKKSLNKKLEEESIRKNKKWYHGLLDRSIELFFIVSFVIGWILYKEGVIFNRKKKVETKKEINLPKIKPRIDLPTLNIPPKE